MADKQDDQDTLSILDFADQSE